MPVQHMYVNVNENEYTNTQTNNLQIKWKLIDMKKHSTTTKTNIK